MVHVLKDLTPFKTFWWNASVQDFYALLSTFNEGDTIDLAECRICDEVRQAIYNNFTKFNFINSEEEDLNTILKHDRKYLTYRDLSQRMLVPYLIPGTKDDCDIESFLFDVVDKIKSQDISTVWTFDKDCPKHMQSNAVFLFMLLAGAFCTKHTFDLYTDMPRDVLNTCIQEVFKLKDYMVCNKIRVLIQSGFIELPIIDENGTVYLRGRGKIPFNKIYGGSASSIAVALPIWFGDSSLEYKQQRDELFSSIWQKLKPSSEFKEDKLHNSVREYIDKYADLDFQC